MRRLRNQPGPLTGSAGTGVDTGSFVMGFVTGAFPSALSLLNDRWFQHTYPKALYTCFVALLALASVWARESPLLDSRIARTLIISAWAFTALTTLTQVGERAVRNLVQETGTELGLLSGMIPNQTWRLVLETGRAAAPLLAAALLAGVALWDRRRLPQPAIRSQVIRAYAAALSEGLTTGRAIDHVALLVGVRPKITRAIVSLATEFFPRQGT